MKQIAYGVFAGGVFAWVFLRIAWVFLRISSRTPQNGGRIYGKTRQYLNLPYRTARKIKKLILNCMPLLTDAVVNQPR